VHVTAQASHDRLGEIARHGTDIYTGTPSPACDRRPLPPPRQGIRPQLAAGQIVLCDRYVASSSCCTDDAVPIEFIEALNAAADVPDLAVILTAHPAVTIRRIERRGAHSRFEAGIATAAPKPTSPRRHGPPHRTRLAAADHRPHPYSDRAGQRGDRWANHPAGQPPKG
jgi:dTMP kinase